MDAITALQVFGSREVVKLADELGRLISHTHSQKDADQLAMSAAWEKLQLAIRADLAIPE